MLWKYIKTPYKKGVYAEKIAQLYLICKGYKILAHRFRHKSGEVDLIAVKKNMLIAIEIKYRDNLHDALHAIPSQQWQRISNSLLIFQQKHSKYRDYTLRFDAIFMTPNHIFPIHFQNIWFKDNF